MNNFISEDPTQPSYYFPVIAGYLSLMVVLYFITSFLKSKFSQDHAEKMSNSFFQETLDPTKIYHENIVDKKNSLKARYIVAYVLTRASMWAKSPYLYTLFTKIHGFTMAEIGILYVVDGISALISGPILGNLADIFGRKFFCLMYCVTTVINLAIRVTGNHPMAYFAQVLTGIGAGLINTTFESWVNCSARNTFKDASPNPEENFKAMERFLKKLFKTYSYS
jgi:hypothetical protein